MTNLTRLLSEILSNMSMNMGVLLFFLLFLISCNSPYTPKPRAYQRINFPEHRYQEYNEKGMPYRFSMPDYAEINRDSAYFGDTPDNPYWINIDFPRFNGRIYISYKSIGGVSVYKKKTASGYQDSLVQNTFDGLRDEAYRLTFKHTVKAQSISDSVFTTPLGITGVFFNVGGNAATATQFFLTDTTKHFLRGALYFESSPNADSLAPVIAFIKEDLKQLINTFSWNK